jgi:hypothetical protein
VALKRHRPRRAGRNQRAGERGQMCTTLRATETEKTRRLPGLPLGAVSTIAKQRQAVPRHAYTKAEVAQALGVSVDYIEDHVWSELRIVRRGRRSFVPVSELNRWLEKEASLALDR